MEGDSGPNAGDMKPVCGPRGVLSEDGEDIKEDEADMMGESAWTCAFVFGSPKGWDRYIFGTSS